MAHGLGDSNLMNRIMAEDEVHGMDAHGRHKSEFTRPGFGEKSSTLALTDTQKPL